MTDAEQRQNTDSPVRPGTNQANTEVHNLKCATEVRSSKIIETTDEKQNPSGQTNSIKILQVKEKQQDSKMTNSENSEDNSKDPDHSEQNTACQSNQKVCDKKEKQHNCGMCDSGETEENTQEITCMKRTSNIVT